MDELDIPWETKTQPDKDLATEEKKAEVVETTSVALQTPSVLLKDDRWQAMREKVNLAVRSGLLSVSAKNAEEVKVAYQKYVVIAGYGAEIGIPPITACKEIYLVDGRPAMSAALMLGLVHQKLPKALFKVVESDAEKCVIVTKRDKDDPNEPQAKWVYTREEAKAFDTGRNGMKDNWKKFPTDMLRSRCVSRACRGEFADVFLGPVYSVEEIEDLKTSFRTPSDLEKKDEALSNFNQTMKQLAEKKEASH